MVWAYASSAKTNLKIEEPGPNRTECGFTISSLSSLCSYFSSNSQLL
ncbi:hypothetical protein BVRB_5g099460 [Beta vulgaris subsp. vulgaris]|nr:hypothetical protein BVRB_5g099460 [Beta vulgaris subsp. vulgaris]